jgi:hypothetical protein
VPKRCEGYGLRFPAFFFPGSSGLIERYLPYRTNSGASQAGVKARIQPEHRETTVAIKLRQRGAMGFEFLSQSALLESRECLERYLPYRANSGARRLVETQIRPEKGSSRSSCHPTHVPDPLRLCEAGLLSSLPVDSRLSGGIVIQRHRDIGGGDGRPSPDSLDEGIMGSGVSVASSPSLAQAAEDTYGT